MSASRLFSMRRAGYTRRALPLPARSPKRSEAWVRCEYCDREAARIVAAFFERIPAVRDNAIGLNIPLNVSSVIKLEFHRTNGYNVEQVADMLGPTLKGSYFISSVSVSF